MSNLNVFREAKTQTNLITNIRQKAVVNSWQHYEKRKKPEACFDNCKNLRKGDILIHLNTILASLSWHGQVPADELVYAVVNYKM